MDKVGFTGTQQGMTDKQQEIVRILLRGELELHHGDCVGADAQAHDIARELGLDTVSHPPEDPRRRAFKAATHIREAVSFLKRNRNVVDETDWLLATPNSKWERMRSGTWFTVRYARRRGKLAVVVEPDGEVVGYEKTD